LFLFKLTIITLKKAISPRTEQWTGLNMLDTGTLDGMSIYEIKKFFPEDFFV